MVTLGIDEVGRGCLAGSVVLAGVLLGGNYPICTLPFLQKEIKANSNNFSKENLGDKDELWYQQNPEFKNIRDSKKLSLKKRREVAELVKKTKIDNIILSCSNNLIDEYGIGVCLSHLVLFILYKLASQTLPIKIIVDGKIKILNQINPILSQKIIIENSLELDLGLFNNFVLNHNLKINRENFADDKYLAVALASNIAKVYRDELMTNLGNDYPDFGWANNKGYGTSLHRAAILKHHKNNPYLRQTFLSKI